MQDNSHDESPENTVGIGEESQKNRFFEGLYFPRLDLSHAARLSSLSAVA